MPEITNPTCWPVLGSLFVLAVLGVAIAVLVGIYKPAAGVKKLVGLVVLLVLVRYFIATAQCIWF